MSFSTSKSIKMNILKAFIIFEVIYIIFAFWIEPLDNTKDWGFSSATTRFVWILGTFICFCILYTAMNTPGENLYGYEYGLTGNTIIFMFVLSVVFIQVVSHFPSPFNFYQQDMNRGTYFDEFMHFIAGLVLVLVFRARNLVKRHGSMPRMIFIFIFFLIIWEVLEMLVWGYSTNWNLSEITEDQPVKLDLITDMISGVLGGFVGYFTFKPISRKGR